MESSRERNAVDLVPKPLGLSCLTVSKTCVLQPSAELGTLWLYCP